MKCQYNGEDLMIAFNARFLIEMLSAADSDEVKLNYQLLPKPVSSNQLNRKKMKNC